jgi:hypothetical protein
MARWPAQASVFDLMVASDQTCSDDLSGDGRADG